jgi:peptide/nickel transport system substrate-binding protein
MRAGGSRPCARRAAAVAALWLCAGCGERFERVVVAYPDIPSDLHPHRGGSEYAQSIGANVYEALTARDAELSVGQRLARSWRTPDERTWVVELEEGVRFHDGTELVAEHVSRSIEAARSDPRSFYHDAVDVIETVAVHGSRTIVFETRRPVADLPSRLSYVAICTENPAGGPPLGTGPYRVVEFEPGSRVRLGRFPSYHGEAPRVASLEFAAIADAGSRLHALRDGSVDLVPSRGVPLQQLEAAAEDPDLVVSSRLGVRIYFLVMDVSRPENPDAAGGKGNPFLDTRVRRALTLAVDRGALARHPDVRGEAIDQLAVPGAFGYHRGLAAPRHDPEAARRLLAEAGYPDGFEVALDIAADSQEVLASLEGDLGGVGIRILPRLQRIADLLERVRRRDTALAMVSWIATAADLGASAEYLLHTPTQSYGRYNGGSWSNPEADALIEASAAAFDPARRAGLLLRLAEIVAEEAPVVPLIRNRDSYALRRGLQFVPRLDRRILGAELRWER